MYILLSPQCRIKTNINHAFSPVTGHRMASLSLYPRDKTKPPLAANPPILTMLVTFVLYIQTAQGWCFTGEQNLNNGLKGPIIKNFETILTPRGPTCEAV